MRPEEEEVIDLLVSEPDLLPAKCTNCGVYVKSSDITGSKMLGKLLLFLFLAGLAVLPTLRSWLWLPLSLLVVAFSTIQVLLIVGILLGFQVAGQCGTCGRSFVIPQYLAQIVREPGRGLFLSQREVSCPRCKKKIRPRVGNIVIKPPVSVGLVALGVLMVLVLVIILPKYNLWWLFFSIPFGLFSIRIFKNVMRKVIGLDLLVLCDGCDRLFTISRRRL